MIQAVLNEARATLSALLHRRLWVFMLLAALGIAGAYQVKRPYLIDIGGPHDCPYLGTSEYCPETPEWHAQETNRWTTERSDLFLPGIGSQPYNVTLRVLGGRPGGRPPPPTIRVRINGQEHAWQTEQGFAERTFPLPPRGPTDSSIHLTIFSPVFSTTSDVRELGVNVDWVRVEPADAGLGAVVAPSISVTLSLLLSLLLVYLLAHQTFLNPNVALGVAIPCLLVMLGLLAVRRLEISAFAPQMAVVLLWAYLLASLIVLFSNIIGREKGRNLSRPYRHIVGAQFIAPFLSIATVEQDALRTPHSALRIRLLAGICAFAFALRFGGMVYPQFISSDLTFHAHKIDFMLAFFRGDDPTTNFFFDGELPNGTRVPYPSLYYLFLAPFEWLLGGTTEAGKLALRFGSALLDAAVVLLVYRLTVRLGAPAALFAAALYAVGPAVFQLYSAGNHSNIFAQTMFVASLVPALEWLQREERGKGGRRLLVAYCLLTTLTLLGHYGMAMASLVVTSSIGLVWLLFAPREMRVRIWPLLAVFAVAIALSYVLYYVHYNAQIGGHIGSLLSRGAQPGKSYDPLRLSGDIMRWQGWVILPLGLAGVGLLVNMMRVGRSARRMNSRATNTKSPSGDYGGERQSAQADFVNVAREFIRRVPSALLVGGWLLACVPLAATALVDRETIRYNLLALPPLCICAGVSLQWLASLPGQVGRGHVRVPLGVAVAGLLLGLAALYTFATWGNLIFNQYH